MTRLFRYDILASPKLSGALVQGAWKRDPNPKLLSGTQNLSLGTNTPHLSDRFEAQTGMFGDKDRVKKKLDIIDAEQEQYC